MLNREDWICGDCGNAQDEFTICNVCSSKRLGKRWVFEKLIGKDWKEKCFGIKEEDESNPE